MLESLLKQSPVAESSRTVHNWKLWLLRISSYNRLRRHNEEFRKEVDTLEVSSKL